MKTTQLNHVALHVADLDRSVQFYRDVLQLEPMPRPAFPFPGAWFRLGDNQELHLIGERTREVISHNRGNHYALMVDDMDAWERYFQERKIEYVPRRTRPDGAYQIYVVDPDGHYVELCTPPGMAAGIRLSG
ncbi:MAG TPA: VOC family protein [Pirellulaceae bacterium]|nr:VOC family protein [Pirellulaceae bacterium]